MTFNLKERMILQELWNAGALIMITEALKKYPKSRDLKELYALFDTYGWEDNWTPEEEQRRYYLMKKHFDFIE